MMGRIGLVGPKGGRRCSSKQRWTLWFNQLDRGLQHGVQKRNNFWNPGLLILNQSLQVLELAAKTQKPNFWQGKHHITLPSTSLYVYICSIYIYKYSINQNNMRIYIRPTCLLRTNLFALYATEIYLYTVHEINAPSTLLNAHWFVCFPDSVFCFMQSRCSSSSWFSSMSFKLSVWMHFVLFELLFLLDVPSYVQWFPLDLLMYFKML